MKIRSFCSVLLALFAIGSVLGQNAEELPIPVETDNQFPPEYSESDGQSEGSESKGVESAEPTAVSTNSEIAAPEPSPTALESQKNDEALSTSTQDDQKADSDAGSENADAEPDKTEAGAQLSEPQPATTIADEAVPAIENDHEQNVDSDAGSEAAVAETPQTHAGAESPEPQLATTFADATVPVIEDNNEQKINSDADSESAAVEPAQIDAILESPEPKLDTTIADVAVPAVENDDEQKASLDADSEAAVAETTQTHAGAESPEPQLATTFADATVPVIEDNDEQKNDSDADSESAAAEPAQIDAILESPETKLETTIADVATPAAENDDEQKASLNAHNEAGAVESSTADADIASPESELEKTLADTSLPAVENNDEHVNKNEDSAVLGTEASQTTSESISEVENDAEQDNNNEEAIETAAAESTIAEIVESTLTTKQERDISETDIVPVQPSEKTSDSTTLDISAPLLPRDVIDQEGSETTTTEPVQEAPDDAEQALTTINDQDVTTEGSETTVVESAQKTTESPDLGVDVPKLEHTESQCPEPCICITEGDSSNYIVDCSGQGLTELPTPIDPKTNTLKIQKNQFTIIPQAISELKNLKNLYANDNLISELESGSVSELTELVSLNLANNNLQEYPKDLENASKFDKLEELDLSGNELKLTPDIFLNLKALRTLTLPEVSSDLVTNLCTLKESLATVCSKSCSENSLDCSKVQKDHSLDATLPGMIPFFSDINKEKDVENPEETRTNSEISDTQKSDSKPEKTETLTETKETPDIALLPETPATFGANEVPLEQPVPEKPSETIDETKETSNNVPLQETPFTSGAKEMPPEPKVPETPAENKDSSPVDDFSLRSAVNNAPQGNVAVHSAVVEAPKESPKSNNETEVKVGAKTTETKSSGGVDKSVIAIIVVGMIIVIAVITIKKNWTSIRNRFSSSPRPNESLGRNTNGTTVSPEEVPLQDKSPA